MWKSEDRLLPPHCRMLKLDRQHCYPLKPHVLSPFRKLWLLESCISSPLNTSPQGPGILYGVVVLEIVRDTDLPIPWGPYPVNSLDPVTHLSGWVSGSCWNGQCEVHQYSRYSSSSDCLRKWKPREVLVEWGDLGLVKGCLLGPDTSALFLKVGTLPREGVMAPPGGVLFQSFSETCASEVNMNWDKSQHRHLLWGFCFCRDFFFACLFTKRGSQVAQTSLQLLAPPPFTSKILGLQACSHSPGNLQIIFWFCFVLVPCCTEVEDMVKEA